MSSIRFSPINNQQLAWRQLGLRADKTLILAGVADSIILHAELEVDAKECLGNDKVEWELIEGAHDFPVTNADEVVQRICDFWKM